MPLSSITAVWKPVPGLSSGAALIKMDTPSTRVRAIAFSGRTGERTLMGSHRGSLPLVTKEVKIFLWVFSEHQLSEGPEVAGEQVKKNPIAGEAKHTGSFSISSPGLWSAGDGI